MPILIGIPYWVRSGASAKKVRDKNFPVRLPNFLTSLRCPFHIETWIFLHKHNRLFNFGGALDSQTTDYQYFPASLCPTEHSFVEVLKDSKGDGFWRLGRSIECWVTVIQLVWGDLIQGRKGDEAQRKRIKLRFEFWYCTGTHRILYSKPNLRSELITYYHTTIYGIVLFEKDCEQLSASIISMCKMKLESCMLLINYCDSAFGSRHTRHNVLAGLP